VSSRVPAGRGIAAAAAGLVLAAAAAAVGVGAVASPAAVQCSARGALADHSCTPGSLNSQVTQANIGQTICVTGFTRTIRPPVSFTNPLKAEQMRSYRLSGPASDYELDHLVSLELGGNPTSPQNLWPEAYAPVPGAHEKDRVENFLHAQVCSGAMTLADAQAKITGDWTLVWNSIK
jgi:hypothetical protein